MSIVVGTPNYGPMAIISDSLIQVLATPVSVDLKTTGATSLYTVPSGKSLILISAILRMTNADTATVPAVIGIGKTSAYNEFRDTETLIDFDTTGDIVNISSSPSNNVTSVFAAGDIVAINVITGATATTATASATLIGYLI